MINPLFQLEIVENKTTKEFGIAISCIRDRKLATVTDQNFSACLSKAVKLIRKRHKNFGKFPLPKIMENAETGAAESIIIAPFRDNGN